ncbi:MAG: hypothetical protein DMG81_20455 [Acidobacteria bacterium]|nr:MAG: hypothetical protein DMG81_20455 [Acidobacteriota bacterium]
MTRQRRTPITFAPGASTLSDAGRCPRRLASRSPTRRPLKPSRLTPGFSIPRSKSSAFPSKASRLSATSACPRTQRGRYRWLSDLSESFAAILPFGIGFLAVDGPGTGQAPIKVSEHSDRMLSAVIDYAQSRPEVDKTRLAIHGVSWGAYWATKMAIVERTRLRGASAQSPPVDAFFQKDFLMNSLIGNREYLFDQVPALMSIIEGANNVEEMAAVFPSFSLVKQGLLGQPMAPMLVIGGVKDTQVPIDDLYLLLSKGDTPKTAWINPQGGHLGRQVKVWPDPLIFKQVIIPWLVNTLQAENAQAERSH